MPDNELVNVTEASKLTGLAPSTLYKLVREGRIRSYKVLHARRFSRADLLALLVEEQPAKPAQR